MNFNFKKLPPFKWFVLQNFPFIEADFDAITYYQLLCKLAEEINKVINSNNSIGQQTESLTEAYNELQNYVEHYFDNLDIQEEINNKLDEMAENGQLTDIIAQYLQLAGVLAFNNVNDMKNATNLVNGSIVKTLGFYSYNDGGGAFYKIRTITNQDIINNIDLFPIINNNNLIAELIYNDEINVLQIGCKNDDSSDISSIINYMTEKVDLYFPAGFYNVSNPLIIKSNIRGNYFHRDITFDIKKDSLLISHIENNSSGENEPTKCVLNISNVNYGFEMKNISIKCNSNENGIYGFYSSVNRINLHHIAVVNIHNAIGIFINSSDWISRLIYGDNLFLYGTNETYANSTGIKILNNGDNRFCNLEIMGCQIGLESYPIIYGDNWHIWTGPLQGHDENNWWTGTRGILVGEGALNNIYIDSAYLPIVGNNNEYIAISNLITMNDNSMNGSDKYDSSVLYNFKGTITNWILNVDNRIKYVLGDKGKYSNINVVSRDNNSLFDIVKLPGSRFHDISYGLLDIHAENKLIEIGKIYIEENTDFVTLKIYHAKQQYYVIKLKFVNGYFDSYTMIEKVGNDDIYITNDKNNNIYTILIDCHSNYGEWINVTVERGSQLSTLNVIDLDIQNYSPSKVDYNSNTMTLLN